MSHHHEKHNGQPRYMPTMTSDYSRTSDTARAVNSVIHPRMEAYLQSIAPQVAAMGANQPFVIADYGTNDGVSSSPLIAAIVNQLHEINSPLKVNLAYADIVGRGPFDQFWPKSHLAQMPGVSAIFIDRSYYEIYPEIAGKLNLGYSSTSVHWLNTKNAVSGFWQHPVNIQPNQLTGAERHKFVEKWKKDWTTFLLHRWDELVPGGVLFMSNLADLDGRDQWPASAGYNYNRDICNEMCAEKTITPQELNNIFVPDYFALPDEFQAVLASPEVKRRYRVEYFEPMTIPCPYYHKYEGKLDDPAARQELGLTLAHEVRSWSRSSVITGLSDEHKDKIDEIYRRLEDKFCRNPKALPFQYCMMELRKI